MHRARSVRQQPFGRFARYQSKYQIKQSYKSQQHQKCSYERPSVCLSQKVPSKRVSTLRQCATDQGTAILDEEEDQPPFLPLLFFYVQYIISCLIERTWKFILPLMISKLPGGFQAVSLLLLWSKVVTVAVGPTLGLLVTYLPRHILLLMVTFLEASMILLTCCFVLPSFFAYQGASITQHPLFYLFMFNSMIECLAVTVYDVAVERDWVVHLIGRDKSTSLSRHNSMLRRVDQVAELGGVALFGVLLASYTSPTVLTFITGAATIALPAQLFAIVALHHYASRLVDTPDLAVQPSKFSSIQNVCGTQVSHNQSGTSFSTTQNRGQLFPVSAFPAAALVPRWAPERVLEAAAQLPFAVYQRVTTSLSSLPARSFQLATTLPKRVIQTVATYTNSWLHFFKSPVSLCTSSFVLLFLNVALVPGGLLTAQLSVLGVSPAAIAALRVGAAAAGFVGTFVVTPLVRAVGLARAGFIMLMWMFVLITCALGVYHMQLSSMGVGALASGVAGSGAISWGGAREVLSSMAGIVSDVPWYVWFFGALVMLSRIGLWAVDIIVAQINQVAVPSNSIATVSSAEQALCNAADLFMMFVATKLAGPQQYLTLTYVSWGALAASVGVYVWWLLTGGHRVVESALLDNKKEAVERKRMKMQQGGLGMVGQPA